MVEIALKRLENEGVVKLDEERKAAMVNNLLVALVSESNAQPVLNAGTLYS
jgi:DNA-binding GntR family transcriptional regulator